MKLGLTKRFGDLFELSDHGRRVPAMEGLRGLAILLVFACHYDVIIGDKLPLSPMVSTVSRVIGLVGATGVDLFFLLSGFLIYRSALRPDVNILSFWRRRLERIYPTFLVVFAIYLVLVFLNAAPSRIPAGTSNAVAYLVANLMFLPGMLDIQALIGQAWSLSYEWFFYLTIPVVAVVLRLYAWPRRSRMILFAALAAGYMAIAIAFADRFPVFHFYGATHVRLVMFLAGMLVFEALSSPRVRALLTRRNEIAIALFALASAIPIVVMCAVKGASATPIDGDWTASVGNMQTVPTFFACIALALVVLQPGALLGRFFSTDWLRWTGNISYSFYLVHSIPMHVVAELLAHVHLHHVPAVVVYLVALPFTIVLVYMSSAALFLAVEQPLSLRPATPPKAKPARWEVA